MNKVFTGQFTKHYKEIEELADHITSVNKVAVYLYFILTDEYDFYYNMKGYYAPSQLKLAATLGKSVPTIRSAFRTLERLGLIRITSHKAGYAKNYSVKSPEEAFYTLLPIAEEECKPFKTSAKVAETEAHAEVIRKYEEPATTPELQSIRTESAPEPLQEAQAPRRTTASPNTVKRFKINSEGYTVLVIEEATPKPLLYSEEEEEALETFDPSIFAHIGQGSSKQDINSPTYSTSQEHFEYYKKYRDADVVSRLRQGYLCH